MVEFIRPFGPEEVTTMRFGSFVLQQVKFAFCSSLAIGLVIGLLLLLTGGAEGAITLDIDLGYSDSVWFLLGMPVFVISLFVIFSPLAYLIHKWIFRTAHET
ncbi:MAG: hypothetical protein V2I26_08555 [Halieaceae bacterium]|jgi:hypothetical protein|nr:hypothetical protein [Halieaceae bacterium]